MRKLVAVAALLGASASVAQDKLEDMVYTSERVTIRLSQADCDIPGLALALVASGGLTPPRAALVTRARAERRACWVLDADSDVLIGDEMGAGGFLPMSAFRPASMARRNSLNAGPTALCVRPVRGPSAEHPARR